MISAICVSVACASTSKRPSMSAVKRKRAGLPGRRLLLDVEAVDVDLAGGVRRRRSSRTVSPLLTSIFATPPTGAPSFRVIRSSRARGPRSCGRRRGRRRAGGGRRGGRRRGRGRRTRCRRRRRAQQQEAADRRRERGEDERDGAGGADMVLLVGGRDVPGPAAHARGRGPGRPRRERAQACAGRRAAGGRRAGARAAGRRGRWARRSGRGARRRGTGGRGRGRPAPRSRAMRASPG